ncbi:olfactory receptor 1496-like [Pelobates fuscus]|uniref:olfactory receptor 1496-like n=1 Tax=Pelobates fuscus TaxID=191477 RepID=UPI002FE4CF18
MILMENQTFYTDFYIVVFSTTGGKQILLFFLFGILYLVCVLWNMIIVIMIYFDHHLHIPMYFLLCNLSFIDALYSSVTLPKLMEILLSGNNRVSFTACFAQLFFFSSMISTEIFLLTAMAFDRYVAICNPLHYTMLMKKRNCIILIASSWAAGYSNSLFGTIFSSYLSFCGSNTINQLFCDIKVLMKISCGETERFQALIFVEAITLGLCPFLVIIMSYGKILSNILKINTTKKRNKTFSTCSSHLTVLFLFYGTVICMYMRPPSANSENLDHILSVFYLVVTPTLNPFIYSMRNKEIKNASVKMLTCKRTLKCIHTS